MIGLFTIILFSLAISGLTIRPSESAASPDPEQQVPAVQLFDMQQEKIVKTFKNDDYFQQSAKQWLSSITRLSPQLTIGSPTGYIVRIPLVKPYTIEINQLKFDTKDVFLVYVPNKPPLLLLFSSERKTYLFETKADVRPFMQRLLAPTGSGAARE